MYGNQMDVYRLHPFYRAVAYATQPKVIKFTLLLNFKIPLNATR